MVGLVYVAVALLVKVAGINWIKKLLPPVVIGPTIMVIGLGLAPVAVKMSTEHVVVALITLLVAVIVATYTKGLFQLLPVFFGIVAGYIASIFFGLVDLTPVSNAGLFTNVNFSILTETPIFSLEIAALMIPVTIVTIAEHIGDMMLLGDILDRNLIKTPGLHRTLIADGVASMLAGIIGGPANTTYGENIGVVGLTKVASVWVIGGAAVTAIILGFFGPFTALVQTVPAPVMGGVSILLFGIIASCGARIMISNKVDFSQQRNLIIGSVILVVGVGNLGIELGNIQLEGMALAAIIGVLLNLILPNPASKTADSKNSEKQFSAVERPVLKSS
jgi:uracil permease